nr:MAG TPA: hypothetical protein [Bacteriophage sp.]
MSILEMEAELDKVVNDLQKRIFEVYDTYLVENGKIIDLPTYESLINNYKLQYEVSEKLIHTIDVLNDLKLRINIVNRNLSDIKNLQITTKSDYQLIANFKNKVSRWYDSFNEHKFQISDLIKNANSKLSTISAVRFIND